MPINQMNLRKPLKKNTMEMEWKFKRTDFIEEGSPNLLTHSSSSK